MGFIETLKNLFGGKKEEENLDLISPELDIDGDEENTEAVEETREEAPVEEVKMQ